MGVECQQNHIKYDVQKIISKDYIKIQEEYDASESMDFNLELYISRHPHNRHY